jgi:hypothetical protein
MGSKKRARASAQASTQVKSLSPLEWCIPDIQAIIFTLACSDGGKTGAALALVSKTIAAQSRPYRFYSVRMSDCHRMRDRGSGRYVHSVCCGILKEFKNGVGLLGLRQRERRQCPVQHFLVSDGCRTLDVPPTTTLTTTSTQAQEEEQEEEQTQAEDPTLSDPNLLQYADPATEWDPGLFSWCNTILHGIVDFSSDVLNRPPPRRIQFNDFKVNADIKARDSVPDDSWKNDVRRVLRYMTCHLRTLTIVSVQAPGKMLDMVLGLEFARLESLTLLADKPRGKVFCYCHIDFSNVKQKHKSKSKSKSHSKSKSKAKSSTRYLCIMPNLSTFKLCIHSPEQSDIQRHWDLIDLVVSSCDRLRKVVLDGFLVDSYLPSAMRLLLGKSGDSSPLPVPLARPRPTLEVELSATIRCPDIMQADEYARWAFGMIAEIQRDGVHVTSVTKDMHCSTAITRIRTQAYVRDRDVKRGWLKDVEQAALKY